MATSRPSFPAWAILNTALLLAPILITLAAFASYRFWFVAKPDFIAPALLALVCYYAGIFRICARTSGHNFLSLWPMFRRSHPKKLDAVWALVGFAVFGVAAFYAFYAVIPAAVTAITGSHSNEQATVASVDSINPSGSCGTKLELLEVSPAMLGSFCIGNRVESKALVAGDRVTLYGRRSVLGFWVTRIER